MRRIDIDAFVDTSIPDLPRVALLLAGVTAVPRLPTLRLTPVDPDSVDTADGRWPEGDLLPMECRLVDDGAEIVLGSDIIEFSALLPGAAIAIELPDLRIKGEFLWPHVPVASRARRRSVVAARRPAPVTAPPTPVAVPPDKATSPPPPLQQPPAQPERAIRPQSQRPPGPRPQPVAPRAVAQPPAPPAEPPPRQQMPWPVDQTQTVAPPPAAAPRERLHRPEIPRPDHALHGTSSSDAFAWHADAARPAPKQETQAPAIDVTSAAPPVHHDIAPSPPGRSWAARAAFAGMVLGSVLLIEMALLAFRGLPAGANAVSGKSQRSPSNVSSDLKLLELLQTPALSPRGVAARETSPDKLLALANASLHAQGGARDGEEGAYWLKRYVIASLGDERMLRALTQLGSTFAEPASGPADYKRARHLWEFAGNLGDPVAMCFLGALHEHGLGVTAEKKLALQWYARAKSAGGCPNVNASIARVTQ